MYQDAINCFSHKKLNKISTEMIQSGIQPIVLRWKRTIRGYGTGFQNVYGFMGCKTQTVERVDGQIEFSGKITPDETVAFFPDEMNIAYALIPECERNLNILAATSIDKSVPWVVEGPADVFAKIAAAADKLGIKSVENKPVIEQTIAKDEPVVSEIPVVTETEDTAEQATRKPGRPPKKISDIVNA
jgi:hypothetical protein